MAQTNAETVIRTQKFLMLLTGMWTPRTSTIFYKLFQHIQMALIIIETIGLFLQLFFVGTNLILISAALGIFIAPFCTCVKNILIVNKGKSLRKLLDILERPIFKMYPDCLDYHMVESSFRSRRISILFQISASFSAGMYFIKSIVASDYLIPFIYEIFNFGKWTICMQCLENFVLFIISWKNLTVDLLVVGLMLVAIGHFNILHDKILNVKKWAGLSIEEINAGNCNPYNDGINTQNDEKINEALKECIVYHNNLLEYLENLEHTVTWISLNEFFNSIIVCCNTGFLLVNTNVTAVLFAMIAYFSCMMFQLSLYCWYGNELMIESSKILDACYHSDWINCGPKVRKSLIILMERAKRPSLLTAAKFADLSLQTFTSILRLTYSYFALMQQLYSDSK